MNKRIIYKTANNGVAVIIPSENVINIEDVAAKDVPAGVQYKIVNVSEIPADRTFRNAWEWQE